MCLTRVGRIVDIESGKAKIRLIDDPRPSEMSEVDVSTVNARRGSYVEVYANVAIGRITKRDAELKRSLRLELLRRGRGNGP